MARTLSASVACLVILLIVNPTCGKELSEDSFAALEQLIKPQPDESLWRHISWETSLNAARRFGLHHKGDIADGLDADIVLVDPVETWVVRAEESESQQGHTPFEGQELSARVKTTFLRGNRIFDNNEVIGEPRGRYLKRPC